MITVSESEIVINSRELKARLLGSSDERTMSAAAEHERILRRRVNCSFCVRESEIVFTDVGCDLGYGVIESLNLRKNLLGCRRAYTMAISLGAGADMAIRSAAVRSSFDQFVCDAVASAMAEALADYVQSHLPLPTKARFSPGYGDLPLSVQPRLLSFLNAQKEMGIVLSDSLLMTPTKSITAIAGIKQ